MSKRSKVNDGDLKNLIEDLRTTPVSKKESSLSTRDACREIYFRSCSLYKEPLEITQQLFTVEVINEPTDEGTYSVTSEGMSNLTIRTKDKDKLWGKYFECFYVDASYNTITNYTKYLESSLKLLTILPDGDIRAQLSYKIVYLTKRTKFTKTLVLDLDETLIHSDLDFEYLDHDVVLNIDKNGQNLVIPLFLRPGLYDFLTYAKNNFEVILFTSSCKDYADSIIDYLDPARDIFSYRLYRESCVYIEPGIYIKDLRIFVNRDPKDLIVIDNSIISFANQLDNGILVSSFYDKKEEKEEEDCILNGLMGYLNSVLLSCEDIREKNKECLRFSEYKEQLYKIVKKEIIL
jgi:Dullard-like phosphatase family protein